MTQDEKQHAKERYEHLLAAQQAAERRPQVWHTAPWPAPKKSAFSTQVGGDHYQTMAIQPFEYIHANGLGFAEGCIVKYVSRWRNKNGLEDLRKARHFIDLLIEAEEKKNG